MKKTLTIPNVDLNMLEEQRLTVNQWLAGGAAGWIKEFVTDDEIGALEGILNMLDYWSDNRGVEE